LLEWPGKSLDTTRANIENVTFSSDPRSIASWYHAASYGQISWTGAVTPILSIADPGECRPRFIANRGIAAARAAGYEPDNYTNVMFHFPDICGFDMGDMNGPYTWVSGVTQTIDDGTSFSAPIHELGHNLGLYHSHGLNCGPAVISKSCLAEDWYAICDAYGNAFDVMGSGHLGDLFDGAAMFNARQLQSLGWFSGRARTVTSSGNYDLAPLENPSRGIPQALTIGSGGYEYTLEYRRPLGVDSWMSNLRAEIRPGVLVNIGSAYVVDRTGLDAGPLILDFTPDSIDGESDFNDAALPVGHSYTDALNGAFTITVDSADSSAAHITITRKPAFTFSATLYSVRQGAGRVSLVVTRPDSSAAASVDVSTTSENPIDNQNNWSTEAGRDYRAVAKTLYFPAGVASRTFDVPIIKTELTDGSKAYFVVRLSNPSAGTAIGLPFTALVAIVHSQPASFSFGRSRYMSRAVGSARFALVTVSRNVATGKASIWLWTFDKTAHSSRDYESVRKRLCFRVGQRKAQVKVLILRRALAGKRFGLALFSPSKGFSLAAPRSTVVTISR
jgi:hypothetical protein